MRWRRGIAIVAAASTVSTVARVSAFAQTDTHPSLAPAASAMIAMHTPGSVMRVYVRQQPQTASSASLPPNVSFPGFFRPVLESMLQRSSTFRRQCLRIANTPNLIIQLRNIHPNSEVGGRARTRIVSTDDGRIVATADIRPLDGLVELIAHEFEHVIEQLDGVDLPARAALSNTGVRPCGDGTFETNRAVRVGLIVAQETRNGS